MAALGLGGYGSDDEEEEEQQQQTIEQQQKQLQTQRRSLEGVHQLGLFGSYSIENGSLEDGDLLLQPPKHEVTAAPDVQEAAEGGQGPSGSQAVMGVDDGLQPANTGEQFGPPDPSDPFSVLPPSLREPPNGRCSQDVRARLSRMRETMQRKQRTFLESLRAHREYTNPDFLQQLVRNYNLQEAGTAFPPDVFDPTLLPSEDYADELARQADRESERRRDARAAAPPGQAKIPFERGTGALGMLPASQSQSNLAAAGAASTAAAGQGTSVLLNIEKLREQVAKNAAAMQQQQQQQQGRRSKWDSAR